MTSPPLDPHVRGLDIRMDLRALVDEYAWRADERDYEGFADLFVPDGRVWSTNPGNRSHSSRRAAAWSCSTCCTATTSSLVPSTPWATTAAR